MTRPSDREIADLLREGRLFAMTVCRWPKSRADEGQRITDAMSAAADALSAAPEVTWEERVGRAAIAFVRTQGDDDCSIAEPMDAAMREAFPEAAPMIGPPRLSHVYAPK